MPRSARVEQGQLRLGLFDERNLLELSSPEYPGERLVACRNPALAELRTHQRAEFLAATEKNLGKIKARVDAGKLVGADKFGVAVGKIVNPTASTFIRTSRCGCAPRRSSSITARCWC